MKKISGKTTKLILYIVLAIAVIYDIIVLISKGFDATISYQIWLGCKAFMFLPLALGTVVSHFTAPDLKLHKHIPILRFVIWIGVGVLFLILSFKTMPIAPIHPFIMMILGIGNGIFWHQHKLT